MFSKKFLLICAAAALLATAGLAQTKTQTGTSTAQTQTPAQTQTAAPSIPGLTNTGAPKIPEGAPPQYIFPETAEQRRARLGTPEDPGPNPDPNKHFWRWGKSYHIEKFDRRFEAWDAPVGFVRPIAYVNLVYEVYQLDSKNLWVWFKDPEPQDEVPPTPPSRYNDAQIKYLEDIRSEFSDLTPKAGAKTIRFQKSSEGLPVTGSWRNSLAVADMNDDGCPDIVTPPERKGHGDPSIFLGDCKGHWTEWKNVKWPRALDYGNVVAADLNKDGHADLVFGVHLLGISAFLGDGKGNFKEASQGLPRGFATRRVAVADVDRDGYPDIVAIAEGVPVAPGRDKATGRLRVYFNRNHGAAWEEKDIASNTTPVGGDWLTLANLTGTRYPDIVGSSIFENSNQIIFLADGSQKWKLFEDTGYVVPFLSFYGPNAAGKFSSRKVEDAIVSYTRFWPPDLTSAVVPDPPTKNVVGIDRITFTGKEPKRIPIVRWSGTRSIGGVAVGDFDHDGNLDIIYTRHDPREAVILLGDGKGGFTRANVEGLTLDPLTNYDITVADVNKDGRPDVIVMYESGATSALAASNGSIQVFLNRGATLQGSRAKK